MMMNAKQISKKAKDQPAIRSGLMKWGLVNLTFLLILGISTFLAAGRLDWSLGWFYLGVIITGQTATTLILLQTKPALLAERAWMQPGSKRWDTVIVGLGDIGWLVIGMVAGLDARLNLSPHLAIGLQLAGWGLMGAGSILFLWAMASNRFFSSFMRIQSERGHMVETGGPYRYVRQPGYLGAGLIYSASPLALASLWTFVPTALMVGLFIYRTIREDQTLQAELTGYVRYTRQVRFRLLPGIW